MPNIKSAKKRVLVAAKKTLYNRMVKSALRTRLKKFEADCATGDAQLIAESYSLTAKSLDQATAKGVIHKNAANRKKSQLALKVNKLGVRG